VAEDVEKVNPDLVARDHEGKPYTVRYEAVNAMLLNEFLKEHQRVQELKKQVAELTAGLQRVTAQLELSQSELHTVQNNH
jgi:molecular chaperone GrpE (heat shock protein)